ncbi:SRPBCC domain-containing protein [Aquabacterium sp. A7-Y]|uniref:SRPBCC family protein n=1 Tax=Aquabacterium sp. A7-Y TaxID=1349605 RepID=UPI00223CEC98|nr:SRPBCC domain-containing protein [Aquabacterium sp. A7-Y]MCW7537937.1 SRPBCC domain-containing protein [Aquabacterium sp. A7-Y]
MSHAVHSVTLTRRIAAPADDLYTAWTEPELMRRWLRQVAEADVIVAGHHQLPHPDGLPACGGEYRVLEPGHRIVQTFHHRDAAPDASVDEFVEVRFRPLGPHTTELTVTNGWEGLKLSDEERVAVQGGWAQWLDLLEAAVSRAHDTGH